MKATPATSVAVEASDTCTYTLLMFGCACVYRTKFIVYRTSGGYVVKMASVVIFYFIFLTFGRLRFWEGTWRGPRRHEGTVVLRDIYLTRANHPPEWQGQLNGA